MPESKYKIKNEPEKIIITSKDSERNDVQISLANPRFFFHVEPLKEADKKYENNFGLYDYHRLSADVRELIMKDWEPPEDHDSQGWPGINEWVETQAGKAIGKRLHAEWKRLLGMAEPRVRNVQKAIFAATFKGSPEVIAIPELYENDYLVHDIINYPAAAAATVNIDSLARGFIAGEKKRKIEDFCGLRPEILNEVEERFDVDIDLDIDYFPGQDCTFKLPDIEPSRKIDLLRNWMNLYSDTGEKYTSLNRTLMNLPGNLPAGLMPWLQDVHLKRPIKDRVELIALLLSVKSFPEGVNIMMYANRDELEESVKRVAEHTRNDLSVNRTRSIKFFVNFVKDYPEYHNGRITGLTKKAIDWHIEQREEAIEAEIEDLAKDKKTEKPPIEVPEDPRMEFLDSVEAITEEAKEMKHCVASYAREAVEGSYYLFHVTRKGEEATVAVDHEGEVPQAHGPQNHRNKAAAWGKRRLSKWGSEFPEEKVTSRNVEAEVPF